MKRRERRRLHQNRRPLLSRKRNGSERKQPYTLPMNRKARAVSSSLKIWANHSGSENASKIPEIPYIQ